LTRIAPFEIGDTLWNKALDRGALLAAAQVLGLAKGAVNLAVDYAKTCEQFGMPIGANQAVKHVLATQQVKLSFARAVVLPVAPDFAARDLVSAARVSHPQLVAAEIADGARRAALQVFGAIGFCWQAGVHFYFKSKLGLSCTWGTAAFHPTRVAQQTLNGPIGAENSFPRFKIAT
jgi:alkylation response protein AidB-like acyl-CoA dehydrogenase